MDLWSFSAAAERMAWDACAEMIKKCLAEWESKVVIYGGELSKLQMKSSEEIVVWFLSKRMINQLIKLIGKTDHRLDHLTILQSTNFWYFKF